MEFWLAVVFFLALFIGVPVIVGSIAWRTGLRQEFFFCWEFLEWVILLPAIMLFVATLANWLRADPILFWRHVIIFGALSAYLAFFYSLGFVHGLLRRRKTEGLLS